MAIISSIGLSNFRVFKDDTFFSLSPITILTGPNSSGKSSLFKALLLLKNNSSVNSLWKLDFSGNSHRLGTFKTTKNELSFEDELLKFNIEFELIIDESITRRYPAIISNRPVSTIEGVRMIPFEMTSGSKEKIGLNIGYKQDGDHGKLIELEFFSPRDKTKYVQIHLADNHKSNHSLLINMHACKSVPFFKKTMLDFPLYVNKNFLEDLDEIAVEIPPFLFNALDKKIFSDDFARVVEEFDREILKTYEVERRFHFLNYFLREALSPLLSVIGHFEYIEAFRANTRRVYTNDSQGTSFNELLVEFNSVNLSKLGESFINKWLKRFKIADSIVFEKIEGVASTVYLKKGKEKKLLADLGFGITQFLPILMKIALQEPIDSRSRRREKPIKKLILLEEPETNLHPKFQSLVAEMISDAMKFFEVRFIIETHSEYFIRKLQYLTAKKEISEEDTTIYYIYDVEEKPEDKSHVEKIKITSNGSLNGEFGEGFFDEANNIIGKIWEVR